jgi:hypothetical protein
MTICKLLTKDRILFVLRLENVHISSESLRYTWYSWAFLYWKRGRDGGRDRGREGGREGARNKMGGGEELQHILAMDSFVWLKDGDPKKLKSDI